MKTIRLIAALLLTMVLSASAEITRVDDGGMAVTLDDIVPVDEAAVLVFHTAWNQESIQLLEEIENWASTYPNLNIVFINVVDDRTQVYRQFSLEEIPSIVVIDRDHNQTGETVDNVADMEQVLSKARLI